jgi:hypothetical protein
MSKKTPDKRGSVKIEPEVHSELKTLCQTTGLRIEFFVNSALRAAIDAAKAKAAR